MAETELPSSKTSSLSQSVVEVLLILAILFVVGSGHAPDSNEAHYLSKARHFWNPDWCPTDPFLQSADAHFSFYWVFGWVTHFTTLTGAAWIGRFSGWLLLAIAWQRLSWIIAPKNFFSVLSAVLWGVLVQRGHMSGEWIIGGVEAKIFAYPMVLLGLADLIRNRWRSCWLWFGIASALHVLVGGWAVVMAIVSWRLQPGEQRPRLIAMLPAMAFGGLLALPGLIPAIQLSLNTAPELRAEAHRIYVHQRLPHHLLFRAFETSFIVRHLILIVAFVGMGWRLRRQPNFDRLWGFVVGAVGLALTGTVLDITLAHTDFGTSLLRYYWFRPSDVFIPLGISFALISWIRYWETREPRRSALLLTSCLLLSSIGVLSSAWQLTSQTVPAADRQGNIKSPQQWNQWRDLGDWCSENLAPDALVLTPAYHQTFRWYAGRSELVNWKDIPQDAAAIVEWKRRRENVDQLAWLIESQQYHLAKQQLLDLAEKYAIDFIVLPSPANLPGKLTDERLIPRYQNSNYILLQIK
ncbi:MAG: hypothetical protein P8N76_25465 [Pirellulaceae bacterium]|nr:hypothetical protein [Pirellulaceae bacterium]